MRIRLPWLLGAWLLTAIPVLAQPLPSPSFPAPTALPDGGNLLPVTQKSPTPVPSISEIPALPGSPPVVQDNFRFWARAEYLAYWVKNTPLPISLVTGDPNNPEQELLNADRNLGTFSGFRVGLGIWLDPSNNLGLETNLFSLQRRTREFFASSDAFGDPILAFPFTNQAPGAVGNFLMPITSQGQFAGNVLVSSSLQLWGAEANAILSLFQERSAGSAYPSFEVTGLLGFRYLNLSENLSINTLSAALQTNPNTILFQSDQFGTRNQFYGAQLGGRINWQGERFGLDVAGKLAIGATHQSVDIQGYSVQSGPGGVNGTFPGGFFTQPSNIGRTTTNQFAVVPSVEVKFHVLVTSQLRAFVGYDFMYWTQVVRPGAQVDRNINLSQSAIFGNGALLGPANPTPLFNRTDFWAQGINVGLEFRF